MHTLTLVNEIEKSISLTTTKLNELKKILQKGTANTAKILWEVTTSGRTAKELIKANQKNNRTVVDYAKDTMHKKTFTTHKGITWKLVGIPGTDFDASKRTPANIYAEAKRMGYISPPAEIAPELREKYTQKELGYRDVVICHEPISVCRGSSPVVLVLAKSGNAMEKEGLHAYNADPDTKYSYESLFVFALPQ